MEHDQGYPTYDFSLPVDELSISQSDPMIHALMKTSAFLRLKQIKFLGGIDYTLVPYPNGADGFIRYSRHQHSLGVARLAILYSNQVRLKESDRRLVIAAALLHDIGHCPLSHTLEPVFYERFGINHHVATEKIITGAYAIGEDVARTLWEYDIDPEIVVRLISGDDPRFDGFFSGPINFDTIEGILRSWLYSRYGVGAPNPDLVTLAATRRATLADKRLVDEFWVYKDWVYRYLIRSDRGVIADFLCQQALRHDLDFVVEADFLSTEKALFQKCPTLRSVVYGEISWEQMERYVSDCIPYVRRSFVVNEEADFFGRADKRRYGQLKEPRFVNPSLNAEEWFLENRELFNGGGI